MSPDMGNEYQELALQISRMFCLAERSLCTNKPEQRAARMDQFANRMIEFVTDYIEGQRTGMKRFTQAASASQIPPPLS